MQGQPTTNLTGILDFMLERARKIEAKREAAQARSDRKGACEGGGELEPEGSESEYEYEDAEGGATEDVEEDEEMGWSQGSRQEAPLAVARGPTPGLARAGLRTATKNINGMDVTAREAESKSPRGSTWRSKGRGQKAGRRGRRRQRPAVQQATARGWKGGRNQQDRQTGAS